MILGDFATFSLALLSIIGACVAETEIPPENAVDISLAASWNRTPYKLNVLEAAASVNESLYEPLVLKLLNIEPDYDNGEFNADEDYIEVSDSDFLNHAMSLLHGDYEKYMFNLQLSNHLSTARINAHFQYYNTSVKDTHECDVDAVLFEPLGPSPQHYCDPDAAFMLQNANYAFIFDTFKLPFDRRLGSTFTPSSYIIYGDYRDETFRKMFLNMYQFAGTGKLNLVWRYVNTHPDNRPELLAGYGAALNLKKTDYIAIDDSGFTQEQESKLLELGSNNKDETVNITDIYRHNFEKVQKVDLEDLSTIGLKFTKLINESKSQFKDLMTILAEFPKYARTISKIGYSEDELKAVAGVADEDYGKFVENGIYINDALVPVEKTDLFEIFRAIKREVSFIKLLQAIDIHYDDARTLMSRFAQMISPYFASTKRRFNFSRYDDLVVYLNNIEEDYKYSLFDSTIDAYIKKPDVNELPRAKENIHQMIFIIDLTDLEKLENLISFLRTMFIEAFPIQFGVVPLSTSNELNEKITSQLYSAYAEDGREGAFKYLITLRSSLAGENHHPPDNFSQLEEPLLKERLEKLGLFYKNFGIDHEMPTIFSNGVVFGFHKVVDALNNVFDDMLYLYDMKSQIGEGETYSEFLRKDSVHSKDTNIVPERISQIKGNFIKPPSIIASKHWFSTDRLIIEKPIIPGQAPITINLLGSFFNTEYIRQVEEVLRYSQTNEGIKIVISDVTPTKDFKKLLQLQTVEEKISFLSTLVESDTEDNYKIRDYVRFCKEMFGLNFEKEYLNAYIVVAGRKVQIKNFMDVHSIESLVHYECASRLNVLKELENEFDYNVPFKNEYDRFQHFAWVVSYTYFFPAPEPYSASNIPRFHRYKFSEENTIIKQAKDELIEVDILIDPVSEYAQELVSFIPLFEKESFITLKVHLRPKRSVDILPINRFYKELVNTDVNQVSEKIRFEKVPEKTLFNVELHETQRWLVSINNASTDLDNLMLDLTDSKSAFGEFLLENILVEGYTSDDATGLPLEISGPSKYETTVLANTYFQLKANPGTWTIKIKDYTKGSLVYMMPEEVKTISVIELDGTIIDLDVQKRWLMESISLVNPLNETGVKAFSEKMYAYFFETMDFIYSFIKPTQADINIFSIASGHLYERFLGVMVSSVMKNTNSSVKFWFIENYMSPDFKKKLPLLSEKYGFDYELIMYKWPVWLDSQRERQRTIWGYKILFLDLLFPQDLKKVIYVDADQIVRADLKELVDIDLEGAPYGYVPMCDSKKEMESFRFWKTGYWKEFLGLKYKYHISALYVVDLEKLREVAGGDILRQQYQYLSKDPESLSNLDQDLPNLLQPHLKIYSLSQEWLWCETWCSNDTLKDAKTIDLCNNPQTKEPKLNRAKRQIQEWVELDQENMILFSGSTEVLKEDLEHDEL